MPVSQSLLCLAVAGCTVELARGAERALPRPFLAGTARSQVWCLPQGAVVSSEQAGASVAEAAVPRPLAPCLRSQELAGGSGQLGKTTCLGTGVRPIPHFTQTSLFSHFCMYARESSFSWDVLVDILYPTEWRLAFFFFNIYIYIYVHTYI